MTLVLIDGDILLYKAAHAVEREITWPDGEVTRQADEHDAAEIFESKLKAILTDVGSDNYIVCLSDKENFRRELLPAYKANRKDLKRPLALKAVRNHVILKHNVAIYPRLEADDVLGILATQSTERAVIVTLDKDLAQIPVDIYNPDTRKWSRAAKRDCERLFYMQVLTGDTIDNYSGCAGIGPSKAAKILSDPRRTLRVEHVLTSGKRKGEVEIRWGEGEPCSMWEAIVDQFLKAGQTKEDALTQARVARILQSSDYQDNEIILWGKQYE